MDSIGLSPALGLSCLKDLRLENCNLSCLPNEVGNLISLETLDLSANNLPTLPDSICDLTRLKRLTLGGCNLSHLPCEIGRLISLDTLGLQGNSLSILPDSILNLACLKSLHLNGSNVTHLPSEIGRRLISLETLNLDGNRLLTLPDSICNLASLEALFLNDCNLSHLPDRIGMLSSLKLLELQRNNVCSLPNSFSDLASLEELRLNNCGRLQSLPQLPVNILRVDASCCTSLENIPIEFNWQAGLRMSFGGCNMLAKSNSVNNFIERLHQYKGWSERSELHIDTNISLPLDEVPNWFEYQCAGSKFSLVVPPLENRRIVGWSFCVVFSSNGYRDKGFPFHIFWNKPTLANPTLFRLVPFVDYQGQDQMIFLHRPLNYGGIHCGDELEIEIIPNPWERVPLLTVKKCGIHFIYEDNIEGSGGRVEKWRDALTKVANLSGWDLPKVANGTKRMDSIGLSPALGLSCLKDLRMENCNLSCLPNEVGHLILLETLDLSANNMPTLPDSICDLTCLKRLTLEGCNLSHLPCEIGRLILLEGLSLAGNSLLTLPDSICNLACLKFLNLNDCNLSHLPDRIGILSLLEILYLERNNVCSLPNSFSDLASLWKLRLNDCGRLQSLPQLPVNLKELDATYCTSLESIPTEFNWRAGLLMSFLGCNMLAKNNVMERIDQSFWEDKKNRGPGGYATIYLPGDEIPNWFQYQYAGSKLSVVVPPRRILGWSLCIVVRTHGNRGQRHQILIIRDKFTELDQLLTFTRYQGQDQMILLYYPSDYIERDELEIEIIPEDSEETEPWLTVKKCGINFIYEDNTEMSIKKKRKITDIWDPDISSPRN
ncbi:hypothetical protein RHSIM_Rhsim13G0019900 [Rhododendron simsii]|uniref:Uncharacterized protein n=1 Tax=Rhododendron simsii TaxID=118357 RepID=A0A834L841_RHOSS|nr:hypothetical protein RHSIM_Rhsim13G0019900 [Rhododendron simsii]